MRRRILIALTALSAVLLGGCALSGASEAAAGQAQSPTAGSFFAGSQLPQDPHLQVILIAGVAEKMKQDLARRKALTVHSLQRVSFATESLNGLSVEESTRRLRDPMDAIKALPPVAVEVEVEAEMTRDSMRSSFKRPSAAQPEMILELTTEDGKPMFRETHWYADRKAYLRGEPYPIDDPSGVEGLKVQHAMFAEIEAKGSSVCTLAEFFYTWVGKDTLFARTVPDGFARSAIGDSIKTSRLGDEDVFEIRIATYDVKRDTWRSIRTDSFAVTTDFKLVAWRTERVYVEYGVKASYLVDEKSYFYPKGGQ